MHYVRVQIQTLPFDMMMTIIYDEIIRNERNMIMSGNHTRHFTEDEVDTAVNCHYMDEIEGPYKRWTQKMTTIVNIDDHYYRITWERGLTEMNEDKYYEDDYPEVEPHTRIIARSETEWIPVDKGWFEDPAHKWQWSVTNEKVDDAGNIRDYVSTLSDDAKDKLRTALLNAGKGDYSGIRDVGATDGMVELERAMERYNELLSMISDALS